MALKTCVPVVSHLQNAPGGFKHVGEDGILRSFDGNGNLGQFGDYLSPKSKMAREKSIVLWCQRTNLVATREHSTNRTLSNEIRIARKPLEFATVKFRNGFQLEAL
ncbi:uncharacterized protein PADG_12316 [Paracoccidioides brasiliensis Pb18]|uniref:Uncharacterized protein n=1 Tax=Paracoccidioides brasiliensis (strain Pb18) TaxID=502780 RepID=A0A0A0HSK5_PARBD|nr:uncharacterized protein PADG_12316 [Paracoccidioides brasiliensis Pb18]KGM91632.1 hypothetical protein PADG_12316 [Paracoccidioides brasiliensis Pb18]